MTHQSITMISTPTCVSKPATASTKVTSTRRGVSLRPHAAIEPVKTDERDADEAITMQKMMQQPSTSTSSMRLPTTRRAALLATLLGGVATVTTMTNGVEPALAARGGIFDDDDDPFARNDGGRVLDRAASTSTAGRETENVVTTAVEEAVVVEQRQESPVVETEAPAAPAPETAPPAPARVTQSSTELDTKALLNNQRVRTYNNAPADFPEFVREGYDVRVIHGNDYIVQPNGLIVKDYLPGSGESPKDNQECTFDYVAYNENGGTIDSTYRRGAPATSRIGINGMIPGFELGLKTMRPGGKRRIIVPPELGPPVGPATFFSSKQWEVFDIELKEVKSCSRSSFGMVSSVVCE